MSYFVQTSENKLSHQNFLNPITERSDIFAHFDFEHLFSCRWCNVKFLLKEYKLLKRRTWDDEVYHKI